MVFENTPAWWHHSTTCINDCGPAIPWFTYRANLLLKEQLGDDTVSNEATFDHTLASHMHPQSGCAGPWCFWFDDSTEA